MLESLLKIETLKTNKYCSKKRVRGLDNIRFLCAIWVACSHGGYPKLTVKLDTSNDIEWFINGIYTSLFCGPAAVIVFFLISGFCIHYPYKDNWNRNTTIPFLLARLTRISIPITFASIMLHIFRIETSFFYSLVGWSIICEIVYYFVYPFARTIINTKEKLLLTLFLSYSPTSIALFVFPIDLVNYPAVGGIYVIFLGLPCWILGVILCYFVLDNKKKSPSYIKLLFFRFFTFSFAFLTHILALQKLVGHPFTLNFFAIISFFWLKNEINFYANKEKKNTLESLGRTSYSIYLMHSFPFYFINTTEFQIFQEYKFFTYWALLIFLTFLFYFIIEKPSHQFSRKLFIYFQNRFTTSHLQRN